MYDRTRAADCDSMLEVELRAHRLTVRQTFALERRVARTAAAARAAAGRLAGRGEGRVPAARWPGRWHSLHRARSPRRAHHARRGHPLALEVRSSKVTAVGRTAPAEKVGAPGESARPRLRLRTKLRAERRAHTRPPTPRRCGAGTRARSTAACPVASVVPPRVVATTASSLSPASAELGR